MEHTEETSSNNKTTKPHKFSDDTDTDNIASTPFVSAPSSPGDAPPHSHIGGFFYSAPASPVHHRLSSVSSSTHLEDAGGSFEFELTGEPLPIESMTSADELFFNGQIRPMKLSSHLQHPQDPGPLSDTVQTDSEFDDDDVDRKFGRARVFQARDRRRKARSMSPMRSNITFQWIDEESAEINEKLESVDKRQAEDEIETEMPSSGASSRSSSVGRSSKRWVFLKELLYRSKSEGRNSNNSSKNHKFWSTLPFSPSSGKKSSDPATSNTASTADESGLKSGTKETKSSAKKAVNGVGMSRKRRTGRCASAHEVHYNRNRAQMEEMRKKTYLPYRQGLLGCLGFSSKGYGAMNGFARALNPVSSR